MWRNYLVVAVRNLARHRLYSALTIGGLALGLAACLLIFLFVRDELSYDRWLRDSERLGLFEVEFHVPGRDTMHFAGSPGPLRAALEKEFPSQVETSARMYRRKETVKVAERQLLTHVSYADPTLFEVLELAAVAGDRRQALADARSIALTQKLASQLFGNEPALGKVLTVDGKHDYTVVAVLADLPENTHLAIDAIALLDVERYRDRPWIAEQWTSANMALYVKFRSQDARAQVAAGMKGLIDRNVRLDVPGWEKQPSSSFVSFPLQPVQAIHLHSRADGYPKPGGELSVVLALAAIAALILIIACINFVNLATARAMQRAREVAMRKVLGATRRQLVLQHLGEAVLTAGLALVLALALVELALPPFSGFVHKSLALRYGDPSLVVAALGLVLAVGALGGLYPALYLSRFEPARVLKANQSSTSGSATLRNALVVFQFAVSIALIACTAVVYAQTVYARTVDLGYAREHRASLGDLHRLPNKELRETLRSEVAAIPGVRAAALSSDKPPLEDSSNDIVFLTPDQTGTQLLVEKMYVDLEFFRVLEVKPLAGRLFSADFPGDFLVEASDAAPGSQAVVVNQTFVRKLGLTRPEEAVGKVLWQMADEKRRQARTTIVGVVPDLYLRSLRDPTTPFYFVLSRSYLSELTFVFEPGRTTETMAAVEKLWHRLAAGLPMQATFLDDAVRAQYDADEQRGTMFAAFAGFAVLIACLGLFGLAAFSAERRTKEIGMRKVLGASVLDIVRLLVWQFSRPVLLANLIAWPVAFVLMQRWLGGFRNSISLTAPLTALAIFGGAGLVSLLIAWLTTGGHAYRVARGSPSRALRYE